MCYFKCLLCRAFTCSSSVHLYQFFVVVVNLRPLVTCDCCEYVFQLVLLMILRMTVVTGHDVCKLQAHVCVCVRTCVCVCAYVCV